MKMVKYKGRTVELLFYSANGQEVMIREEGKDDTPVWADDIKEIEGLCVCGHTKQVHNYDFSDECSKYSGGQCSRFREVKK